MSAKIINEPPGAQLSVTALIRLLEIGQAVEAEDTSVASARILAGRVAAEPGRQFHGFIVYKNNGKTFVERTA